jgi:hypothetical protein
MVNQPLTDSAREAEIERLGNQMVEASTLSARHSLWLQMRELILHRSPEQVARMERERGLG